MQQAPAEWVTTAAGPGDHNGTIQYCVIDEPATLVWAANLAALEIHAPMALAGRPGDAARWLSSTSIPDRRRRCVSAATHRAARCATCWPRSSLHGLAKTSGSKGLQLYVPAEHAVHARSGARRSRWPSVSCSNTSTPTEVLTSMTKADRKGKVFVDWSQNARFKTTIAVYSLRARPRPDGVDPVTWDEVARRGGGRGRAALRVARRAGARGRAWRPLRTGLTDEQRSRSGRLGPSGSSALRFSSRRLSPSGSSALRFSSRRLNPSGRRRPQARMRRAPEDAMTAPTTAMAAARANTSASAGAQARAPSGRRSR